MKQVSIFLLSFLTALCIHAQPTSAVTVIVDGNKDLQLSVGGRDYNTNSGSTTGNKTTLSLNSLEMGQQTLQVSRTDPNSNQTDRISTVFTLRPGYDMLVKVNGNSSLELIETKRTGMAETQTPMSNTAFVNLLRIVRAQQSAAAKRTAITNAFTKNNNYFTSSQVRQLLQLVNAENFRIQLAKSAYPTITDRSNFYMIYDLVNSQAGRNELQEYVNNYNEDTIPKAAMTNASFTILYQDISKQWPVSTQMNSLINTFNNSNHYFSAYQASQLIKLVTAENNRLQIAKLSWHRITDPANFNQVLNLVSSQAGKNELTNYVNNYKNNTGNNPDLSMSEASFNTLYQRIQQQWPVSTQVNSLSNSFTNTGAYFSTYQATRLIQLINAENERLMLAKLSWHRITDQANFNSVYSLLNSQASKNELEAYVISYKTGNTHVAMADASYNSLYQTIQRQGDVNTLMASLTNAFSNNTNYFTSNQARQLIQLVSTESNRLHAAKLSYRSITDPANFSQVSDLFNSQSSRDELAAYVRQYNGSSSPNPAMSDASFATLYQSIQGQFFPNEKMNSLTTVFNNADNYFTSSQAKQLIQLVSLESNRLQLAKLSYRGIADRENFTQVYSLLSSQDSRDELDAYVKAYKA